VAACRGALNTDRFGIRNHGASNGATATKTAIARAAIGVMCTRKSLKVSPDRLAMMMLGGSPINVAAPPILGDKTSAIKNGTGEHLMQASSDIFLGWFQARPMGGARYQDYYVRQLRDWNMSP
jgi:hypothetical protein